MRLFDEGANDGRDQARVVTAVSGHFDLGDLRLGEYDLRVSGPGDPPVLANAMVRTGSTSVRVLLGQMREVWVDGFVSSRSGEPLSAVLVSAEGLGIAVQSGADGRFGFALAAADHRRVPLSLQRDGFEPARVGVDPAAADDDGIVTVDVTLTPAAARLSVTGQVVDSGGQGLPGRSVYLSGSSQGSASKYRAITDGSGGFAITDIRNPGVYVLSVAAGGGYAGFQEQRFEVPDRGVQGYRITLDPVATGSLTGTMIDAFGRPLPNFTLIVLSASAPRETISVTSDGQGWFSAENVPAGPLRIQSQSFPRFVTSGVTLAPGGVVGVDVLVDQGDQQLMGWATDDAGQPLAGAELTLSWVQRDGGLMHESVRQTTTDRSGAFFFAGLGPGARELLVRAPRHQEVRLNGVVANRGEPLRVVLPRVQ